MGGDRERTYGEEPRRRNPGVNRDRGAVCASASRGIDTKNPETEIQQRSATSGSVQSDVIFILLFIDI